ncbi:MAG: GNAT family N-acetyltransferase [Bacteroidales bacterium]
MIDLRLCTSSDLDELVWISRTTYYDTFKDSNTGRDMEIYLEKNMSPQVLEKELDNPDSFFYFVTVEGQLAGYFKMNRGAAQIEQFNANAVELERFYLLEEFKGRNIATLMLGKAIEFALSEKAEFLWLGVWERNFRAMRFYEKNGFVKFGKHDFVMGEDVQTDYLMKLIL